MKKIGFVDLYLSEWHADNYPRWIRELNRGWDVAYGWAEQNVSPVSGKTTAEWCKEQSVTPCATLREICEQSDAIVLLAPSDPEVHLRLAEQVLPFGKPTYVDKTFAPDTETAAKIFALAEQYGTPIFSTSALRYAEETAGDFVKAMTTGGGRSVDEYIVHQAEMIVKILGTGAASVTATPLAGNLAFAVEYPDGREGAMIYGDHLPFALSLTNETGKDCYRLAQSQYFPALMGEILTFFDTGIPPVSKEETLEVMALRQAALAAANAPGTKILL